VLKVPGVTVPLEGLLVKHPCQPPDILMLNVYPNAVTVPGTLFCKKSKDHVSS
jgi:hypothetical protein